MLVLARLTVALVVACGAAGIGIAQQVQPPAEFQDLYAFMAQELDAFDQILHAEWDGGRYPVTLTTELLTANGNRGRQLLPAQTLAGVRLELDRLHALGVMAVTVAIPFPLLYQPFLQWNGDPDDYQPFINFFAAVVDESHARGMKVAVESAALFPGVYSAGSGINAAAYYPTLGDSEYVTGRSAVITTIVREIRPDVINVGSEPDTEYRLTGQALRRTPQGFAGMVHTFLDQLAAAGLTGVPVVAGTGTWMAQAGDFVAQLCALDGLWGIDLHLYPLGRDFLPQALTLAAQARAHGKKVTMLETWDQKERDSELATIDPASDPTIYARDVYSFWAPLDQRFLTVMATYSQVAKLEYLSPYWSRYFFAYLDYDQVNNTVPALTAAQIFDLASKAEASALVAGQVTDTGRVYADLIADLTGAARARRHLQRR
jgi:hypothetical protein